MNVLAYDSNVYLVNIDRIAENVYMVNIRYNIVQGYDNIHKIMRFGHYVAFNMNDLDKKLENKVIKILVENNILYRQ